MGKWLRCICCAHWDLTEVPPGSAAWSSGVGLHLSGMWCGDCSRLPQKTRNCLFVAVATFPWELSL